MRRGYLGVAEQLPSHGDFIRHTALASFASPNFARGRQPVAAAEVPTFSFTAESPFATDDRSPV